MMQSISHWGQFEMQAAGTENFRDWLTPAERERLNNLVSHKPTSFSASRQDRPSDPKLHEFY